MHTSASLHTLSQPNATAIAPHGGYSMPTEVVHHAHLPYRMLQPSFQTYPLSLSGPMPTPKPGHISNDLGPPIFMPREYMYVFVCLHPTVNTLVVFFVTCPLPLINMCIHYYNDCVSVSIYLVATPLYCLIAYLSVDTSASVCVLPWL